MFAHVTKPRRDEQAIKLLRRMLAAGLSCYEPDPLGAIPRPRPISLAGNAGQPQSVSCPRGVT